MVGSNTETNIAVTYQDGDNTLDFVVASDLDTSGNAATATALETARTIGGTSFNGTANIAVGLSATTTALASARTIGGVSFDGTGNINLPGVNTAGNQATSGLAATATLAATTTALASARTIGGVSFDGTGNINLPGVNTAGNQATSGLAATATLAAVATAVAITDNEDDDEDNVLVFVAGAAATGGNVGLESDGHLHYNPSTGKLTATSFAGAITGTVTGSASEIAVTAVTDNDTVYPVFVTGTSGDNAPEVASALTYNPSTGLLTATGFSGPITGNVTGNASGTSGSTTGNAATVTTNANLTGHVTSSGNAAVLGSFTSAQLAGALTNETGSGLAVFGTSPTLATPILGTPQSGNLTNCTNAGKSVGFIIAMA
jgi:hypothetical protein